MSSLISAQGLTKNGSIVTDSTISTLKVGAITYPNSNGTNGQVLTTDGAGNTNWATPSSGGVSSGTLVLNTASISSSSIDNYDVSGIGILFVVTSSSWVNVNGLSGGVKGQVLQILNVSDQGTCCAGLSLLKNSASGTQKIMISSSMNIDYFQGATLIFDGIYWRVLKLGSMM